MFVKCQELAELLDEELFWESFPKELLDPPPDGEEQEDASDADDIDAKDESPSAMSDPANDSLEPRTMPKEAIIKPDALLCLGVPSISLNCSSTCWSRIISEI